MEELIPISVFAMIVAIVYLNVRKKERMALLQYGKDASVFRTVKHRDPSLKYGLLLIFLGVALLIANFLVESGTMREEPAYFSLLSLAAGISLLLSFFLERRKMPEKEEDKQKEAE
jgi:predicted tellurium resistance membrane protein TerC